MVMKGMDQWIHDMDDDIGTGAPIARQHCFLFGGRHNVESNGRRRGRRRGGSHNNNNNAVVPEKYLVGLANWYGATTLPSLNLAKDVLQVRNGRESYRAAYLRKGRSLLAAYPSSTQSSFDQATRTPEFQALTAAYEIMSTPAWKRHYEKHGLSLSSNTNATMMVLGGGGSSSSSRRLVDLDDDLIDDDDQSGTTPLLRAEDQEEEEDDDKSGCASRSPHRPTTSQFILPLDDDGAKSGGDDEVATPTTAVDVFRTTTSTCTGSPVRPILQRCNTWNPHTTSDSTGAAPTMTRSSSSSNRTALVPGTSVRPRRVLRWTDDEPATSSSNGAQMNKNNNKTTKKASLSPPEKDKKKKLAIVSPSSVMTTPPQDDDKDHLAYANLKDGHESFLPPESRQDTIIDESHFFPTSNTAASSEAPPSLGVSSKEDAHSVVVAEELFREMTRPLGSLPSSSSRSSARRSPRKTKSSPNIKSGLFSKNNKATDQAQQLDLDDSAIKDAAVWALLSEIPSSTHGVFVNTPERKFNVKITTDSAAAAATTPIDLGKTRFIDPQEALLNTSSEATTRGYVRFERFDNNNGESNTKTPSAMETSAITYHSQGSDHRPVGNDNNRPIDSLYQMLGLDPAVVHVPGVGGCATMVGDVPDIEFLTTIDGYVKTVADGLEGLGKRLTCEMEKVDRIIDEMFRLPDDNVASMLHVLRCENEQAEGALRELYGETERAASPEPPALAKSSNLQEI